MDLFWKIQLDGANGEAAAPFFGMTSLRRRIFTSAPRATKMENETGPKIQNLCLSSLPKQLLNGTNRTHQQQQQ
jgi:hypothetical protein